MAPKYYPTPTFTLTEVKEQFKHWRKTRKSPRPIPTELWTAAVSLSANHSISRISKEVVVDYSRLKKRVLAKALERTNAVFTGGKSSAGQQFM